jgi:hypothetical protein
MSGNAKQRRGYRRRMAREGVTFWRRVINMGWLETDPGKVWIKRTIEYWDDRILEQSLPADRSCSGCGGIIFDGPDPCWPGCGR